MVFLAILCVEKKLLDETNTDAIINAFASGNAKILRYHP